MRLKEKGKNEFWVELLIDTNEDNPGVITSVLGLTPTKVISKGEQWYSSHTKKLIEGKFHENNVWIYRTPKRIAGPDSSSLLDTCIEDLLIELERVGKEKVKMLLVEYPVRRITCFGYYYDSHEFFVLKTKILSRLAFFETDLVFDCYNLHKSDT